MGFWRTVAILNRHKWLIALSAIVAAIFMWGAMHLVGSRWKASVELVSAPQRFVGATPDESSNNIDAQFAPSELAQYYINFIRSKDVGDPIRTKYSLPPDFFFKNVDLVATGRGVFELSVTDTSRSRATLAANGLATGFISALHEARTAQARDTVKKLKTLKTQANADLIAARNKYDNYRNEHGIIGNLNLRIDAAVERFQDTRRREDQTRADLAQVRARLVAQQTTLAQLPPMNAFVEVTATGPLAVEQAALTQAEQDLAEKRIHYTDQNPLIRQALKRRDALKKLMDDDLTKNLPAMAETHPTPLATLTQQIRQSKQDLAALQGQLQVMDQTRQAAEQEIHTFKGVDTALGLIASEVAEKGALQSAATARLNAATLALDNITQKTDDIAMMTQVDDYYNPPVDISQGRTVKLTLLAALAAMLCTSALLVALNSVDRRLKTVKDANVELPARILAAIPQPHGDITYANLARVTELQPQSLHSEAYRFLGLHLLSAPVTPPATRPKSIMILAAKAEQGSTTTLTNLGITLAQAGKRVIIVDANMRTAEIHTVFGVDNEFGFTDVLRDPEDASLERALQKTTLPNLHFITSGSAVENPWILFRSKNLIEVSRKLHEQADYVLYDTPSSLMFTDALNLAPVVDAAILCVRALEPLTGTEDRLVEMLEQADVAVMGSVLTDVPTSVLDGFRNYQHYYEIGSFESNGAKDAVPQTSAVGLLERPMVDVSQNGHKPDHRN